MEESTYIMECVIPLAGVSPNDVIVPLRGDEEGGVANMDIVETPPIIFSNC